MMRLQSQAASCREPKLENCAPNHDATEGSVASVFVACPVCVGVHVCGVGVMARHRETGVRSFWRSRTKCLSSFQCLPQRVDAPRCCEPDVAAHRAMDVMSVCVHDRVVFLVACACCRVQGKVLNDKKTIAENNIGADASIEMSLRISGGMEKMS